MFKLNLGKAEIKLPVSVGSLKKQENTRKTFASLTMLKPLTVWITTNCEKFLEMGLPDHLTCLLRDLYAGQEGTVRTRHGTTDWFQIGKEVHEGYILLPCLFNLCAELIIRNSGTSVGQTFLFSKREIENKKKSKTRFQGSPNYETNSMKS